MSYNFLKSAHTISNALTCLYDSNEAFSTDFQTNGDVDGWTEYYNVYFYCCWNNVLFGTSADRYCYINRQENFLPVVAEDYYYVDIMMKITNNNTDKKVQGLTTGKLQWLTLSDEVWDSDKSFEFDVQPDDTWRLYQLNLGPAKKWVGEISNLRVYPFLDGWEGDQFSIKYVKIRSTSKYTCNNTQCSYYTQYVHPCPAAGQRGTCVAGSSKALYNINESDDLLIVNIDSYGEVSFHLGSCVNMDIYEMARTIGNKLSTLSIGGYCYSSVGVSDEGTLAIKSGTAAADSSVYVENTPAAIELGFYDSSGQSTQDNIQGEDPASGFEYASSRLLTAMELNKVCDGLSNSLGYTHDATQYSVEAGRSDYNEIGFFASTASLESYDGETTLSNRGKTLIDWSHPVNNNGKLNHIYIYASIYEDSKIKICRPRSDGTLRVVHTLDLVLDSNNWYTAHNTVYHIDCDIMVNKGDVLAVYNADVSVGISLTGVADATYSQTDGEVEGIFDPGIAYSTGIGGFALYARSDRYQTKTILDIDMGERLNVEECNIYGNEDSAYLEYNIAMCEDVNWKVDLHGGTHLHAVSSYTNSWTDTHTNIAYGHEALTDGRRVAENGVAGQGYSRDSTGVVTVGEHLYFYVNGDAEWLQPYEYSDSYTVNVSSFTRDPITFTLEFPGNKSCKVHKCVMYFKEQDNFRNFAIYYGLGQYGYGGNYLDAQHKLIPSYNYVKLDGIQYDSSNNADVAAYIFENPSSVDAVHDGNGNMINTDTFFAANACDWTVLEHGFDPVDCYDFNIHCTYHNSTKITELEVYSSIYMKTSLVDNVRLSYSTYGGYWKEASFAETADNINAFIGGAPRYFRLELQTTDVFQLNEIELLVGDQVVNEECDDVLLLDTSKEGKINPAREFSIKNTYDRPCDLLVDLPKETNDTGGVIYWSKLAAEEDITSPSIGPSSILRKADDQPLVGSTRQCAINCPCYGLKNLVHGKDAYYTNNGYDWFYHGTLTSGTDTGFRLGSYVNTLETEVNFPAVSSLYWKLHFSEVTVPTYLKDFLAFYGGERVDIEYLYLYQDQGSSSLVAPSIADSINLDLDDLVDTDPDIDDDFNGVNGSPPTPALWSLSASDSAPDHVYIQDNKLHIDNSPGVTSSSVRSSFILRGNFDIQIDFTNDTFTQVSQLCEFLVSSVEDSTAYAFVGPGYTSSGRQFWTRVQRPGSSCCNDTTLSRTAGPGKIRIIRTDSQLAMYFTYEGDLNWYSARSPEIFCDHDVAVYFRLWKSDTDHNSIIDLDNFKLNSGTVVWRPLTSGFALGFKTYNNVPIDSIKLVHETSRLTQPLIYTSYNNAPNFYPWQTTSSYTSERSDHFTKFVVDLQKRHSLDIIRNYGPTANYLIDNIEYSRDSVVETAAFDSTSDDVRLLSVKIPTSDDVDRYLNLLGIYPNISIPYCKDGGYNCEWQSLSNVLTRYSHKNNIAYTSEVVSETYYGLMSPENAIDGNYNTHTMSECWAFSETGSELELLFDQTTYVDAVRIHHGYDANNTSFVNTAFTVSVSTTTSGQDFADVFSVTGNTDMSTEHYFDPVEALRIKLTVDAYNTNTITFSDGTTFDGGFVREFEVYESPQDFSYINSEDWPVVCIDLQDKFTVATHGLFSNDPNDDTISWDNSDEFFKYSDSLYTDPQKVPFNLDGALTVIYNNNNSSGDRIGHWEYTFTQDVFLEAGTYLIDWQGYDVESVGESGVRLEGNTIVDVAGTNTGNDVWSDQEGAITVPEAGYYDIKGRQFDDYELNWGIRYIRIYRTSSYSKWVAVRRDTATGYSYDNDTTKQEPDILDLVHIYGTDNYSPTQYSWWWDSTVSVLSNNYLYVKDDGRSLQINYPASTDADVITLIPGDWLALDRYWSIYDLFSFKLYIEDITLIDLSTADITFGTIGVDGEVFYRWSLEDRELTTGWNDVRLKFSDYTAVYPDDPDNFYGYIDNNLDLSKHADGYNYVMLRYAGLGEAFTLYLTSLKIERNTFDEDVKFDNGLCLTRRDFLQIPVSGLTLAKGTIEFWLKTYYDSYGRDLFNDMSSRTLFSVVNNSNDLVSLGIKAGHWLELAAGHVRRELSLVDASEEFMLAGYFDIGTVMHIALVWSNDGKATSNGDTLRLYINNVLIYSSKEGWAIGDSKDTIVRLGGGNTPLAYNYDTPSGGGFFDNVKIHDVCKDSFDINKETIEGDVRHDPNDYLEISEDGLVFYGSGSQHLPLEFSQVPAGESKSIFLRSNKTDSNFANSSQTANLLVSWLTTV